MSYLCISQCRAIAQRAPNVAGCIHQGALVQIWPFRSALAAPHRSGDLFGGKYPQAHSFAHICASHLAHQISIHDAFQNRTKNLTTNLRPRLAVSVSNSYRKSCFQFLGSGNCLSQLKRPAFASWPYGGWAQISLFSATGFQRVFKGAQPRSRRLHQNSHISWLVLILTHQHMGGRNFRPREHFRHAGV